MVKNNQILGASVVKNIYNTSVYKSRVIFKT